MDALAGYDSDEDNYEKQEYDKGDRKSSSKIAGDNYDNVQMDLSEESSSGSSSKAGGSSKYSSSRDIEDRYNSSRSDRNRDDRHSESRRDYRKSDNKRNEERKRKFSPERREQHRRSSEKERRRGSDDRERRGSSVEKDKRGGSYHRYRPDERHSKSSRRSKSPSTRRRSRSRERYSHKRRERSRSPLAKKPESSSSPVDKGESIPAMTNEQFLASITLAQKLAQQVQPPKATATSISGLPGLIGNPSVTKIQEQLQKRRMLWQQAKPETKEIAGQSNNNWEGALLPKDDDGKMTAKFKRLMGIKGATPDATSTTTTTVTAAAPDAQEQLKKQDDMFNNMERQYEVARLATHTHRGLGLGFGAFQCNPR